MSEKDALESFASSALRRNKPGSYEQLLCQHLIKAVIADPIEKIRLICEAAMMVPKFTADNLDTLYNIATSFVSTKINVFIDAKFLNQSDWDGVIAWSIPRNKESYEKNILPWARSLNYIHRKGRHKAPDNINECEDFQLFWYTTFDATNGTLEVLKSRFTIWAMPQAMRILEQLTEFVSPDVYTEMLERVSQ